MVTRRGALAAAVVALLMVSAYYVYLAPYRDLSESPTSPSPSSSSNAVESTSSLGTVPATDWATYHEDNARSGFVQMANFTSVKQGWVSGALDGKVYAEPLVVAGVVYVATENNSVYALGVASGTVIWRTHLGAPVPGSTLPCGDISPSGITGTPVIDVSSQTLYVVAFMSPPHHVLYALRLSNGSVAFSSQADAPGSDPTVQQQRSALTLSGGMVYVPYGGLDGDCGQYHGYVVGINADGSGSPLSFKVPTQREGGIWATSGAAVDGSGNLYVATGNGASSDQYDSGDSVIELSPSLQQEQYFAPTDWSQLNSADSDLGSVGPSLVTPSLLFQIGKSGVGYLISTASMGGVGGQVFSGQVCGAAFGGLATDGETVVVPCTDGLTAVSLQGSSFQAKWKSASFFAGPPIMTDGVVWTVDTGSGRLLGYGLAAGNLVYSFNVGGVVHFCTPSAGAGHVFVSGGDRLYAFVLS